MARSPATHASCPRCGGRLARDNNSGRCTPCQAAERDRLVSAPTPPAPFWEHAPLRQALTERHFGKVIRAYRHHPYHGRHPLPQAAVAGWLGITQAQLSRTENNTPIVHLDRLTHWAELLRIPAQYLWFKLPEDREEEKDGGHAVVATRELREPDLHFLRSLRAADRQVGGAYLYATVCPHLREGAHRTGPVQAVDGAPKHRLAAAASLHEMAGWMAHDSGNASLARKHLADALALAQKSTDRHLAAQTYASLSHLAGHMGDASAAVSHARDGLNLLRNIPPHGSLKARLLALRARGLAMTGEAFEAGKTFVEAESAFTEESASISEWLSPFDAVSFTIEGARCFLRVGDLSEAQSRLQGVLVDPPKGRVRSQAFARLMLVTALLGKGRIDEACDLTYQALDHTASLGSAVVLGHLRHVAMLLKPRAAACADVPPLLDRLNAAIRERAWIGVPSAYGGP
jgi:transcriptional regulator with XRE-family HTH domain